MGGLTQVASVSSGALNQGRLLNSRAVCPTAGSMEIYMLREKLIHLPSQRQGDLSVSCSASRLDVRAVAHRCPSASKLSLAISALQSCSTAPADGACLGQLMGCPVHGVRSFGPARRAGTSRRDFRLNCTSSSQGLDEDAGEGAHCELPADYMRETEAGSENPCFMSDLDRAPIECGTLEAELALYTGRMLALQRFREEVSKPDEEINVIRGAVCIAQHLYPETSVEEVEAKLERMVEELRPTLPPPGERYPMRMIRVINNYLYSEGAWKGATVLDPDSSCINAVLDRRQGLPITMSLVYMEIAKRVGLQMQGVNLPAHFMCRPVGEDLEFLVDAYSEGKIVFLQDAEEKLSQSYGVPITLNPKVMKTARVSNRSFLARILFNLKRFYYAKKDPVSTLCIINFLKVVRPDASDEMRDHGVCLFLLRRFVEAVPWLEKYLETSPKAEDRESISELITRIRRCCAVNVKKINSSL